MKHALRVTLILITMFFVAQLIGIFVANAYLPETVQVVINETTGEIENKTVYTNIPKPFQPPDDITPVNAGTSIIIALIIAVILMLTLMKLKAEVFLRIWFLVVVILGIALAVNAFIIELPVVPVTSFYIALIIAIPLGIIKIFQRNIIVHNATELLIYPGIATVFIPLLNIPITIFLLLIISVYDIYAVWHAGFMQKMAKYQIEKLRIFSGFLVPYIGKKERRLIKEAKKSKKKGRKIGINVAILGGGDVVFPILLAGVVLGAMGLFQALIIAVGATIALAYLFYISKKGKFYPAMPFISAGCLIALGVASLI